VKRPSLPTEGAETEGDEAGMIHHWWPSAVLAAGLALIVYGRGAGEPPVMMTGMAAAIIGAVVMVTRNDRGL